MNDAPAPDLAIHGCCSQRIRFAAD